MALMNKCPFCMATVAAAAATCEYCKQSIAAGTCYSCKKLNAPGAQVCAFCGGKYLVAVEPEFVPTVKEKPAPVQQKGIHARQSEEFPRLAPAGPKEITARIPTQAAQPAAAQRAPFRLEEPDAETPRQEEQPQPAPARQASAAAWPPPKGFEKLTEESDPENGLPLAVRCLGDHSEMVLVSAGAFVMGSPDEEGSADEHPRHEVWVEAFYIDKKKVTVAQFKKFCSVTRREMRDQPPWSGDAHPVVNINWYDAAAYCEWTGKCLPTEAQWEKAARGGTDTKYNSGDGEKALGDFAWYAANSKQQSHPVGEKKPNKFGLCDMPGGTLEWCQDGYDENFYEQGTDKDPRGADSASVLVCRGGAWNLDAGHLRCARRGFRPPDSRTDNIGFRCVSGSLEPVTPPAAKSAEGSDSEEIYEY